MSWFSRKPTVLMKGTLADRPWAETLAAISAAGHNGQLTLKGDGKVYQIAFANGAIVGAVSPAVADTVQRIALTSHLLQPQSVAAAVRIMGRDDDVEKFTEASGLVGDAAAQFKRRVLLQRVGRTFAIERGEYVLDDKITIQVLEKAELDVRAAMYHGMRMHLAEQRLVDDLREHGSHFILYPEHAPFLEKFQFDAEAEPILVGLRGGTSIPELEALHRDLDRRLVLAVLGALATAKVITPVEARRPVATQDISITRTPTMREPTLSRVPTPRQPTASTSIQVEVRQNEPRRVNAHITSSPFASGSRPGLPRTETGSFEIQKTMMRPPSLTVMQIKQLIASRLAMLEAGTDFFTFLGVPFGAPAVHVRAAYLEFARYLRPERLAEKGIRDDHDEARAVFAQAVIAMTTLTDDDRRAHYISSLDAQTH